MSHLSSSSNAAQVVNSLTVTRPAGANASHILIAAVWRSDSDNGGVVAPAGWTRVLRLPHTAYTASELSLFWALGDVASLVFSQPTGTVVNMIALVSAFSGRNLSAPIGAITSGEYLGTTVVVPSLATAAGDDVLGTWAEFQAGISGPITGGAPGGYTDRINNSSGAGPDMHAIESTADGVAAGSTGALSRACGNFTAKLGAGIVIQAAGGGGGGGGVANVVIM
jgi:hypothetical protein